MTDTTTPATKSPLQSTTIQGAIVGIVGAFAPTLAKDLGLDAAQVMDAVSAILTLAGFAMTVIGRMKATTKLG